MPKSVIDPGVGYRYYRKAKRIINKDGSFNVRKFGGLTRANDSYHWLRQTSWTNFFIMVGIVLVSINLLFGGVYLLLGIEHIGGATYKDSVFDNYLTGIFFSVQTFSTVGYGALYPNNALISTVASIEALFGLLISALATSILFSRFSKPHSRILFSNNALITQYKDSDNKSLQFRIVNQRSNVLLEVKVDVILSWEEKVSENNFQRRYFTLPLERNSVHFFPLTWTIVHIIDEDSPLKDTNLEELIEKEAEVLIMVSGYDDTYGQQLHTNFSYHASDLLFDKKFKRAFEVAENGEFNLYVDKVHDLEL